MSHQEENQTSTHIQPIQLIPEPLPVLTHPVEDYIKWLTCNSSEQPSNSSEQPSNSSEQPSNSSEQPSNSSEQPQIRRTYANIPIYEQISNLLEQPNIQELHTTRQTSANSPSINNDVILYPGMWSL